MAAGRMDKSLSEEGPNFGGPDWNKNCQICGKEVKVDQYFYRAPDDEVKNKSEYPIVHSACLEEKFK